MGLLDAGKRGPAYAGSETPGATVIPAEPRHHRSNASRTAGTSIGLLRKSFIPASMQRNLTSEEAEAVRATIGIEDRAPAIRLILLVVSIPSNSGITVRAARNGRLQLKGERTGASFDLKQAKFTCGPMPVWPRWPAPPVVEVLALQAYLATGAWLVLAQGYAPKELSPLALPMRFKQPVGGCDRPWPPANRC
jgi:hypothetical protein